MPASRRPSVEDRRSRLHIRRKERPIATYRPGHAFDIKSNGIVLEWSSSTRCSRSRMAASGRPVRTSVSSAENNPAVAFSEKTARGHNLWQHLLPVLNRQDAAGGGLDQGLMVSFGLVRIRAGEAAQGFVQQV